MKKNPHITIPQLADILETTTRTVERNIKKLKSDNRVSRQGSTKSGVWEVKI
jgi:predicted HTH transcriptional regulator